ncbi:MAG: hypothetical protein JWN18_562 [Parcubacteria group bacterium]|nr:hypothetical protein [Parcubacteria group bacterium]
MSKKSSWGWWVGGGLVVLALWWVYAHRVPVGSSTPVTTPVTVTDPTTLPGIQTGTAPWGPEIANLALRLRADGLPELTMEGQVLHIHQHLNLFIKGQSVTVPSHIGINEAAGWLSSIHTHDTRGVIHVESPYMATFTLGELFDVWGVAFTASRIGGYESTATSSLKVYANGTLYTGDPRLLELAAHQVITIVYGTEGEAPKVIPSSYEFAPGE